MKKLLVFSPYYPPHIGGLESHAAEFNKNIIGEGYDVTVFTSNIPESINDEKLLMENKSIRIIRFPAFELIPNYPIPKFWKTVFYQQLFFLAKSDFSVVISRTRFFISTLMAMVFAKVMKKHWLHIEHGSDFPKMRNKIMGFVSWLYDWVIGRLVFAFADVVVCNSKASANFAKKLYGGREYLTVYRGINEEKIANVKALKKEDLGYNGKVIVSYLGRLIGGKGVADLLEAVAELGNLSVVCWIIGDGPERQNLERLVHKLNIAHKIVFWGEKSFSDAIGLLKTSDIFVNPSYTEGMPTAVIEAALCRLAIIATKVGGTKEILNEENEVIFFFPHEIQAISRAIKKLTESVSMRGGMGDNAYKAVIGKFCWGKSMKQYKNILEKMELG